jgi:hypothetical protein
MFLTAGRVLAGSRGEEWETGPDRDIRSGISLFPEVPHGWSADPAERLIRASTSTADFVVRREQP